MRLCGIGCSFIEGHFPLQPRGQQHMILLRATVSGCGVNDQVDGRTAVVCDVGRGQASGEIDRRIGSHALIMVAHADPGWLRNEPGCQMHQRQLLRGVFPRAQVELSQPQ